MNLWLSSHFLVAGLFLSSWALTPEECQPLVKPLPLDDASMIGWTNFLAGYNDNDLYTAILKSTKSSTMNVTASPSDPNQLIMAQESKINGTCIATETKIVIDGNTASVTIANVTSMFHLLPTCDGCRFFSLNVTARNIDKLLHKMNISNDMTGELIHIRALYLMGPGLTLKDSDLEHFKQQASCLGFSREPDFLYDSKNVANIISVFHLLPSCDGCLFMKMSNTIRNLEKLNSNVTEEEISIHALYVTGTESTLKDSDLNHFKQQASCFGFSREPDFLYNSKNGFCAEDEGIKMTF